MSRKSVVTSAASAAGIVAIATALAVAVAHGGPNRSSAGRDGAPTSTAPSSAPPSRAPVDLAALTEAIPCPDDKTSRVSPDDLTGFEAVAVFTCSSDVRTYADGEWSVQIREAATPDIAAVVNAIQAPAPPEPSGEYFCDDVLYGEPALVFVDAAGHTLVPTFHRDFCGVPVGLDATRTIHWQELSVRKDTLQQSADELAAGCSHRYKNMNYYEAQYAGQKVSAGGPVFPDDAALLHACVYAAGPDEIDVGTFVTDLKFTAAQSDRLRAALAQPGTSAECAPQQKFALVFDGRHLVDVELGGCFRVLRDDGVGTADSAVLADLFGQS